MRAVKESPCRDCAAGKRELPDEGDEVSLGGDLSHCPAVEFEQYFVELGGGRRFSCRIDSRRRPRKVRKGLGPSTFSMAMSTPSWSATSRKVHRYCVQAGWSVGTSK